MTIVTLTSRLTPSMRRQVVRWLATINEREAFTKVGTLTSANEIFVQAPIPGHHATQDQATAEALMATLLEETGLQLTYRLR